MDQPLISIVIPVYNGARFLRQAIDSALGQTYRPVEILVVDDGSTDDSRAVISSYGPPVQLIAQANRGVAAARNAGIRAASGSFVAFLDQDDWWCPEKLTCQIELFLQDDDVGLVHTEVRHFDEVTGTDRERFNPNRTELLIGRCYERLLLGNAIFNSSVLVRKVILDKVGGFDTSISGNTIQDYELWLRIAQASSLAYLPEKLAVYRLHPQQGMWDSRQSLLEELRLMERLVGESGWLASPAMRTRMASLLEELGVAHLDAKDPRPAHHCFARALRCRWSWRRQAIHGMTYLPLKVIDWARWVRNKVGDYWKPAPAGNVPQWAEEAKRPKPASGSHQALSSALGEHVAPLQTR